MTPSGEQAGASGSGSTLKVLGVFALVGPLVGILAFFLLMLLIGGAWGFGMEPSNELAAFGIVAVILALVLGYLIGIGPAVATGLIAALVSRRMRSDAGWIGLSACVGFSLSALLAASLLLTRGSEETAGLTVASMFVGLLGAVSGAASAWLSRGLRPRSIG